MICNYLNKAKFQFYSEKEREKAINLYNSILENDIDRPEIFNDLGLLQIDKKDFDRSVSFFRKAISLNKYKIEPYLFSSLAFRLQRKFSEAENILQEYEALNRTRNRWQIILERAINYRFQKKFAKSEDQLKIAFHEKPDNSIVNLEFGHLFFEKKDLHRAQNYYERAEDCDEPLPESTIYKVRVMQEQGKFKDARTTLNELLESPNSIPGWLLYLELGDIYRKQHLFGESENSFKKALSFNEDNCAIYLYLGHCYSGRFQYELSQECYEKAVATDSTFVEAHFHLAQSLADQGKFKEAMQRVEELETLAIQSYDWYTHMVRGTIFQKQKKFEDSKKEFLKGTKRNPYDTQFHLNLGHLFMEMSKFEKAIDHFRAAMECDGENDLYLINIALALSHLQKFDEALTVLEMVPRGQSNVYDMRLFMHKGHINKMMGNWEESNRAYSKGLELIPNNGQLLFYLGTNNYLQNQYDDASAYFKEAIDLDSYLTEAYFRLSESLLNKQQFQKAQRCMDALSELGISTLKGRIWLYMAKIQANQGDFDKCYEFIDKVGDLAYKGPDLYYQLGNIYSQINKNEEALEYYSKALACNKYFLSAYMEQARIHRLQKRFKEALQIYDGLMSLEPCGIQWAAQCAKGICLYEVQARTQGREVLFKAFEQARELEKKVNITGAFVEKMLKIPTVFESKKDYPSALRCYMKILESNYQQKFDLVS